MTEEEEEIVDRMERGEPPSSPEDAAHRASYERLFARIRDLPDDDVPLREGWEDRAVARWQRRRWLLRIAVGALVAAFAAACAIAYMAI